MSLSSQLARSMSSSRPVLSQSFSTSVALAFCLLIICVCVTVKHVYHREILNVNVLDH